MQTQRINAIRGLYIPLVQIIFKDSDGTVHSQEEEINAGTMDGRTRNDNKRRTGDHQWNYGMKICERMEDNPYNP